MLWDLFLQHYSKHFLKEVLRQSHKSCLYYCVYPEGSDESDTKLHSLTTGKYMIDISIKIKTSSMLLFNVFYLLIIKCYLLGTQTLK